MLTKGKNLAIIIISAFLSILAIENLVLIEKNKTLKKETIFLNKIIDILISDMNEMDRTNIQNRKLVTWTSKKD